MEITVEVKRIALLDQVISHIKELREKHPDIRVSINVTVDPNC